jgi:hypothetical protein
MPAPTLAKDDALCWSAPNRVKTADFSASAFDLNDGGGHLHLPVARLRGEHAGDHA